LTEQKHGWAMWSFLFYLKRVLHVRPFARPCWLPAAAPPAPEEGGEEVVGTLRHVTSFQTLQTPFVVLGPLFLVFQHL